MPWLETVPVEQRERFIDDHRLGLYDMTELCARYAISRKTGYKWLARYDAGGRPALRDRSRAPYRCPHTIAEPVAQLLVAARRRQPDWGPEKLLQWLKPRHPGVAWPAISTAGDLLARHGLVKKRRRRRPPQHPGVVPPVTHAPNDLWAADFKGQFRTGDRTYCYPLTVTDQHTRYLIACHGLLSTRGMGVRPIFDRLFREYGLPRAIADRQRGAVCLDVAARPHGAQCVVAAPRDSAPADLARAPATERGARTHAQDPEAGGHSSAAGHAPPSNAPSAAFGGSTTTSARTNFCEAAPRGRSITRPPVSTRAHCHHWRIPSTSSSSA